MNFFLKKLNKEEAPVESTPLMFVPGEYFFIERIFVPAEVLAKDLGSFLEMRLEGISPFPLDQLYWGYIGSLAEKSLFLYAMYIGRLTLEEKERILGEEIGYVLPSFISGFGQKYLQPTINFVSTETSISAMYWEGGSNLPMQIETIKGGEFEDQGREELLKSLNVEGYVVEAGYWKLEKAEILRDGSVRFESSYHKEESQKRKANHLFILNEKNAQTWNADIRPKELTRAKHKAQKINHIAWVTTLFALLAFGLLFVGEIIGLASTIYLNAKKSQIARQDPKVKLIEGQESLAQKIEQISQNYFTPFRMLELLNNSRSKNVYFTSVNLGNQNDAVITGVAASVDDLNKYTEDLNATGLVGKYEVGQIASRQGRVTFKMDVKFKVTKAYESNEIGQDTEQASSQEENLIRSGKNEPNVIETAEQDQELITKENTI